MNSISARMIRNQLRMISCLLFIWLYLPHLLIYAFLKRARSVINKDVKEELMNEHLNLGLGVGLLFLLHTNKYYRTIFYHRIGYIYSALISWIRPGDKYFIISATTNIGPGIRINHPYSTILNAESIGSNFTVRHLTTIGYKSDYDAVRPIIGDNVTLGANVTIIGDVKIGNNVIVGAGSVVVKDIPDNSVAVGNPAHVIKSI